MDIWVAYSFSMMYLFLWLLSARYEIHFKYCARIGIGLAIKAFKIWILHFFSFSIMLTCRYAVTICSKEYCEFHGFVYLW